MSNFVELTPCRPQNSVESMGIILFFKDSLQLSKDHFSEVENAESLKEMFDKIKWVDDSPRGDQIVFEKYEGPEKILWKSILHSNFIKFIHKDYRRWKYSSDFCLNALRKIKLISNSLVSIVFLGYKDVFLLEDYENFDYSMMYKKNIYMPDMLFGKYFVDTSVNFPDFIDDGSEIVSTRIKSSASPIYGDDENIKFFRLIYDSSSSKSIGCVKCSDILEDNVLFDVHLTPMHNRLNTIFREVFLEDIQRRVGFEV